MCLTLFYHPGMILPIPQCFPSHSKTCLKYPNEKMRIYVFLLGLRCHYNFEGCTTVVLLLTGKNKHPTVIYCPCINRKP